MSPSEIEPDLKAWFTAELRPHLPMLKAWLRSHHGTQGDGEDIVQESVMRVLAVRRKREIASPKAFLFATARNLARMRLRSARVRNVVSLADYDDMDIFIDEATNVARETELNEELEMLTRAIQALPARCRQVLTLRKIYGMSQKQIATHLGISENTVETQIGIGTKKITDYFDKYEIR